MADKKLIDGKLLERFEKEAPVLLSEKDGSRFLVYESSKGTIVELKFEGETLWLSQAQMAELFGVDRTRVTRHLANIFEEGELDEMSVCAENAHTAADGKSYKTKFYNLDAIISVGYRVNSKQGTMFRRWATDKLVRFATRGYVIDKDRLMHPEDPGIIEELQETVREIRASNQNLYRRVRDICALCQDYDKSSNKARFFFAELENTMLWACSSMTAAELVYDRADATQPNMGLTYFKGGKNGHPLTDDVTVGNNYLSEMETSHKNRIITMLLDYFEDRLDQGKLVMTDDVWKETKRLFKFNDWPLLDRQSSITRAKADRKAKAELKKYKALLVQ